MSKTYHITAKQYIQQIYYENVKGIAEAYRNNISPITKSNMWERSIKDLMDFSKECGLKAYHAKLRDRRDRLPSQGPIDTWTESARRGQDIFIVTVKEYQEEVKKERKESKIDLEKGICDIFGLFNNGSANLSLSANEALNKQRFDATADNLARQDALAEYYGFAD